MSKIQFGFIKTSVLSGDRVSVYFSGGGSGIFTAGNDLISKNVVVIGNMVMSDDFAARRLLQTELFSSANKTIEKSECQLVAASVWKAVASLETINKLPPYDVAPYTKSRVIRLPYESWTYDRRSHACYALANGGGEYQTMDECLDANRRPEPDYMFYKNIDSISLNPRQLFGTKPYVEAGNGDLVLQESPPNFDIRNLVDTGEPIKRVHLYLAYSRGDRTLNEAEAIYIGKFLDVQSGEERELTLPVLDSKGARLKERVLRPTGSAEYTDRIAPVGEVELVDAVEYLGSINGISDRVPAIKKEDTFTVAELESISSIEVSPYTTEQMLTQDFLRELFGQPRDRWREVESIEPTNFSTPVLFYRNVIPIYATHNFVYGLYVKIHDPDLPTKRVFTYTEKELVQPYFFFFGDKAIMIIKIGKQRQPGVTKSERDWYQVKVILFNVTNTELIVERETDFTHGDLIISINKNPLIERTDSHLANADTENPCLDNEDFFIKQVRGEFREIHLQKLDSGDLIAHKVPGTMRVIVD